MYLVRRAENRYERFNGTVGSLEYTRVRGYALRLPKGSRASSNDTVFFYRREIEKLIEKECT